MLKEDPEISPQRDQRQSQKVRIITLGLVTYCQPGQDGKLCSNKKS